MGDYKLNKHSKFDILKDCKMPISRDNGIKRYRNVLNNFREEIFIKLFLLNIFEIKCSCCVRVLRLQVKVKSYVLVFEDKNSLSKYSSI